MNVVMRYDFTLHHRRSLRLRDYDYSRPGAYFITQCAQSRGDIFGAVRDAAIEPSLAGRMIADVWRRLPERFPGVEPDLFVVMPDHLHGILVLNLADDGQPSSRLRGRAGTGPAPTGSVQLFEVVGAFKSITTHRYIRGVRRGLVPEFDRRLWQREYFEHVIRSEDELNRIRDYILENPGRWRG